MSYKIVKIRDGQDVTKVLKQADCPIRNCSGSHRVAKLPDGASFTYYEHGEYPPGMLRMVVKTLLKAGLLVGGIIFLCQIVQVMSYLEMYGWERVLSSLWLN